MADSELEFIHGFVDKRKEPRNAQTTNLSTAQSTINYDSVPNLRTRLAAVNAGYYTATRLNSMTKNDMMFALRLSDDPTGI